MPIPLKKDTPLFSSAKNTGKKIINFKPKKPLFERITNAKYLAPEYEPKALRLYGELKNAIAEKANTRTILELKEKYQLARKNEKNNAQKINQIIFNEIDRLNSMERKNPSNAQKIIQRKKELFDLAKQIEERFGAGVLGLSKERRRAKKEINYYINHKKEIDAARIRTTLIKQN